MENLQFLSAGMVTIAILLGVMTFIFRKNKITTKDLVLVALFGALSAVGAFIKIPLPIAPFSFHIFFVCMAGSLLGSHLGVLSQMLYVLIGLIGIPVFTNGAGPAYVFQPTFGYLIGFILAAYVIGKIVEMDREKTFKTFLIANLVGLLITYVIGVPYLYFILNYIIGKTVSISYVIKYGFLIFLLWDLIKVGMVALVAARIYRYTVNIFGKAQ